MSTPGIIGRTTSTGFTARYHHNNGTPQGLGKTLCTLYNHHFNKDIVKMMTILVDEHPSGWSNIVGRDFSLTPGFFAFQDDAGTGSRFNIDLYYRQLDQYLASDYAKRPQCYCHGQRRDPEVAICSLKQASQYSVDYAYIIDEALCIMAVYYCDYGIWHEIAKVDLNGNEPDWKGINNKATQEVSNV